MQVAYQLCLFVLFEVSKECLSYPRVFLGRITKAMYLCPRAVTLVVSPASSRPLSFFSSSRCHQLSQALLQHYRSIASTTPFIPTLFVPVAGISSNASATCAKEVQKPGEGARPGVGFSSELGAEAIRDP